MTAKKKDLNKKSLNFGLPKKRIKKFINATTKNELNEVKANLKSQLPALTPMGLRRLLIFHQIIKIFK